MDFVTALLISTDWKSDNYDFILVMVDWLTKMVYYKSVKVTINVSGLAKVILDVLVWHHSLLNSIMSNRNLLFTSKFWSSLCYFFNIKRKLSSTFYPQTSNKIERQNSTIEIYL